jgi:Tat protein secretion system quality control protein TatD with DNase activity
MCKVLTTLMTLPRVVAFGEVGLDYVLMGEHYRREQRETLELILHQVAPELRGCPIVLTCNEQGISDLPKSHEDLMRILSQLMLEGVLGTSQLIQLHMFKGTQKLVDLWMGLFSGVYFSIGGEVEHFGEPLRLGLKAIPRDRLLLETDAPMSRMQAVGHRKVSMPNDVHHVAARVAYIRGVNARDLLEDCNQNATRFFRLNRF